MGVLVLRVPNDHINKAAEDDQSLEAKTLRALQKNAAAIHAGDQTYILLGSDTHGETGNGKYVYDVELKGVDGGSKAYKTSELIEARKKDILNVLGASFLLVGQGDTGSHSLSDSSRSVHAFYMERMLMYIKTVFEREFVKSLADINELKLEEDDMPVMTFGELDEADPENNAKVVQLMAGVGMMVKDKSIIIQAHKMTGFDTTEIEKLTEEELLAKLTPDTARVGESGGSSGTGTSQLKNPNSTRNMANSA
jgi:hypothetical protein